MHNIHEHSSGRCITYHKLNLAVLKGLREEMRSSNLMGLNAAGAISEEHSNVDAYQDRLFYDNVSGQQLDSRLVHAARMNEVKGAESHNVWTKVPISECFNATGKAPIGSRWAM